MNKLFCTFLIGFAAIASDKPINFLEIGITDMNYSKPKGESKEAGVMKFVEARMSRADLTFNLQNKDEIFDSQMLYEKDLIKFRTKYMNLEFGLGKDSSFNNFQKIDIKDSLAVINPSFTTFGGASTRLQWPEMSLGVNNFFLFCSANDEEVDMSAPDGIIKGCLTEISVNADKFDRPMKLKYTLDLEKGDKMNIDSSFTGFSILEGKSITFDAEGVTLELDKYKLETSKLKLECEKDESLFELDTQKILKDCENTASIKTKALVLKNKKEKTRFYIQPETLNISNEKVDFYAPRIQIANRKGATTMFGLDVDCDKASDATVYDLHQVIGQCINKGVIKMNALVSTDEKSLWWKYDQVISDNFDPTAHIKKEDKSVWKLKIELNQGEVYVKVNNKKGPVKFSIELKGRVTHQPEKDRIIIHADDVRIPVPYFWDITLREFLVEQIAAALRDAGAKAKGNDIIITL